MAWSWPEFAILKSYDSLYAQTKQSQDSYPGDVHCNSSSSALSIYDPMSDSRAKAREYEEDAQNEAEQNDLSLEKAPEPIRANGVCYNPDGSAAYVWNYNRDAKAKPFVPEKISESFSSCTPGVKFDDDKVAY